MLLEKLCYNAADENVEMIQYILSLAEKEGQDFLATFINMPSNDNVTALEDLSYDCTLGDHECDTISKIKNHFQAFKLLVEKGANVTNVDRFETPLLTQMVYYLTNNNRIKTDIPKELRDAYYQEFIDTVKIVVAHGAKIDQVGKSGTSPLNALSSHCYPSSTGNSCDEELEIHTFFDLFRTFVSLGANLTSAKEILNSRQSTLDYEFKQHNESTILSFYQKELNETKIFVEEKIEALNDTHVDSELADTSHSGRNIMPLKKHESEQNTKSIIDEIATSVMEGKPIVPASLCEQDKAGVSYMHLFAGASTPKFLKWAFDTYPEYKLSSIRSSRGETLLHAADENVEMIRYILSLAEKEGQDFLTTFVNMPDKLNDTALESLNRHCDLDKSQCDTISKVKNHFQAFKLLVEKGANVTNVGRFETPLLTQMVHSLRGNNFIETDVPKELKDAYYQEFIDAIKVVVAHGACINQVDKFGGTPLSDFSSSCRCRSIRNTCDDGPEIHRFFDLFRTFVNLGANLTSATEILDSQQSTLDYEFKQHNESAILNFHQKELNETKIFVNEKIEALNDTHVDSELAGESYDEHGEL